MAEETPAPVPEQNEPIAEQVELVADDATRKPAEKRRIRTRTLFTAALVLGVVGGVAGGYAVQARRQPTPLPTLSVAPPVYPRSPLYDGIRPPSLPANVDDATIANGDLTKLLLPTPPGAKATFNDHGWMSLIEEADTCTNPAPCFSTDVITGVERIADTAWNRSDGVYVEIRILQYQPGHSDVPDNGLPSFVGSTGKTLTLPSDIAAAGYEYTDENGDNDDHAMAVHGSLAVYFWVTSHTRVPDPSIVSDLITQQMARL